jgi:hypothetical protein
LVNKGRLDVETVIIREALIFLHFLFFLFFSLLLRFQSSETYDQSDAIFFLFCVLVLVLDSVTGQQRTLVFFFFFLVFVSFCFDGALVASSRRNLLGRTAAKLTPWL